MSFSATHSLAHVPWVRTLLQPFSKVYVSAAGYRKLGLKYDDLIEDDSNPIYKEAIRRLRPEVADARAFRMKRAIHLDMQHTILPKAEWTKPDEDVRYLTPLIKEVSLEVTEREAFETGNIDVKH
ncbi:Cytochrome b-c1 complex subunit 7 [Dispira parvispora]|uniref:Cytochrome b-c1 complex subunit 7 n=1 Tax=Dispira parvispora TaxID=1520584 RepID=A0A9W8B0Z5_9FUNG|nr:Cytochrome b-c1 complex subunit 7 [Dispira parvispora]